MPSVYIDSELANLGKTHPNDKFQIAKKNWDNQDHAKLHTGKPIKTILFDLNKTLHSPKTTEHLLGEDQ